MENEVQNFYGNRLRVRACGVCVKDDAILLVNHRGISPADFWSPPGGGIQFGEGAVDCLNREFKEEVGVSIETGKFLFACEFIRHPLHAIELFFEILPFTDQLQVGSDPEKGSPAIIRAVRFMPWSEIEKLPSNQCHGIFKHLDHPSKITALRGYFKV
jgi:ADP-ribose pyrophosphatase YjhB (NUDIX family)